ncbi:MAG: response regulator transcription factor [Gemmatimonadaceae bacterium]|nr:response regulator transcription factor [Gemmatimonadaceae bacterium]
MRLLLVEDDPEMSRTAAEYLRRTGFSVDAVQDGSSALRALRLNPYDAVVLDVRLPDISGFDVCRQLRQMGSEARVLMATARDAVDDRVEGLDLGADDYLVKPYAMAELAARVRALLRRPSRAIGTVLAVNDLELDTTTRTARRGERSIELTTKEFAVLEVLMRHAGEVVTRETISASAWDENYDPFSNVIDVYVSRLRRKIDMPGEVPLVVSVRGAGYRLGAPVADNRSRR